MELKHSMNEKIEKCPKCGSTEWKRVFSPIRTLYKTIGFYTTDHNGRLHLKDPNGRLGS